MAVLVYERCSELDLPGWLDNRRSTANKSDPDLGFGEKYRRLVSEQTVSRIARQMFSAVQWLDARGVAFRSLRLESFYVKSADLDNNLVLKLSLPTVNGFMIDSTDDFSIADEWYIGALVSWM